MQPLVLFDLDNTLVDRRFAVTRWTASFRSRYRVSRGDEAWLTKLLADRATPDHFEAIRSRFQLDEPASALWDGYRTEIAAAVSCSSGVLRGLEALRKDGWRVGIATNGPTDIQWAKLRSTGISERVDAVCISAEVGTRKPDPAFFIEAIRRCNGIDEESQAWMVGDSAVNDVSGGHGVGLRTIWVDRDAKWPEELSEPDHRVPDARAAIDLLCSLGPRRSTT
ncbi:HAD family hydrolase [Streptomyces sp. NPDC005963]|uniref:HAD family hydrolase n=1 Tax=Streptomyces sp. NPDC005963 TaxID=3156721 RepID=UPI0033E19F8B